MSLLVSSPSHLAYREEVKVRPWSRSSPGQTCWPESTLARGRWTNCRLPFCRPALRKRPQSEMAVVLMLWWNTRGLASLHSEEKMMRQLSTASTTWLAVEAALI